MSTADLQLQMTCQASELEIEQFLGVHGRPADADNFVGPIEVDIFRANQEWPRPEELHLKAPSPVVRRSWFSRAPPPKDAWTAAVLFSSTRSWSVLRTLLALKLSIFLHRQKGGYYFAADSNGAPCFALGDFGLIFPPGSENYFSRYPAPFQEFGFHRFSNR
jgi:hypothetical protein